MANNTYAITIEATIGRDLSPAPRESPLLYVKPRTALYIISLATVQSEAINGFFIRLVKSLYIKASLHRYGARDALLSRYRSTTIYPSSLHPFASSIFSFFHLSPRGRMKLDGIILSPFRNDSFSLLLPLSFSLTLRPPLSSENFFGAAAAAGNEFWSRRLYIFSEQRVRFYRSL